MARYANPLWIRVPRHHLVGNPYPNRFLKASLLTRRSIWTLHFGQSFCFLPSIFQVYDVFFIGWPQTSHLPGPAKATRTTRTTTIPMIHPIVISLSKHYDEYIALHRVSVLLNLGLPIQPTPSLPPLPDSVIEPTLRKRTALKRIVLGIVFALTAISKRTLYCVFDFRVQSSTFSVLSSELKNV